ncbi:MAG: AraC family transcriptional regulator [Marinobacter sp.]|nr:AraC family transcriptional regulator [Marinobacter sp.]
MPQTSQWPLPTGSARYVIPERLVAMLDSHPLTQELYPLAFGHYRQAQGHHMHREQHTDDLLIYCTEGRGFLSVDNSPITVEAGDLVLIPRGHAHRYTADPAWPWSIYWVHYRGSLADAFRHHMGFAGDCRLQHLGRHPRLLVDFNGLLGVQQTGFRLQGLVHVANRLRQLLAGIPLSANEHDKPRTLDLDAIHSYMREHLHQRITLEQLADIAGLSPAYFATLYRQTTGESPVQHLLHLKVEQACQLLDNTALPFAEISRRLGYEDSYYFSRLFKKTMGLPPRDYRLQHRG